MAVYDKIMSGKFINMRSVSEEDSEFIVKMRSDPEKNKYVHAPAEGYCVEMQNSWLEKQRETEGDYYFLISGKDGSNLGTIGIYNTDFKTGVCELGRWISYGLPSANLESALFAMGFVFGELNINTFRLFIDVNNRNVHMFWKHFGAQEKGEVVYGNGQPHFYMEMSRNDFCLAKGKVEKMLARLDRR